MGDEHVDRCDTPQVYAAWTDPAVTERFWAHRNVSQWRPGALWQHRRVGGDATVDCHGVVREAVPGERLVFTFEDPAADPDGPQAPVVTLVLTGERGVTRVDLEHTGLRTQQERDSIELGWQAVLANLKTLLETGEPLPAWPWEVGAG